MFHANDLISNRYELTGFKGKGAYGEVWLAYDKQLNLNVALKFYVFTDDKGMEEFKSSFKITYGLNHPNLLQPSYYGVWEKGAYLVMPYCPGVSSSLIGCSIEQTLWYFVRDVALGLSCLHSNDIIHHDIKPDNILIGENGKYLITDFGISTKLRGSMQRHDADCKDDDCMLTGGTPGYMAPELFVEHPYSVFATDIWALGVTLYEMITNELPFFGEGGRLMKEDTPVPEIPYGFVSNELKGLVKDCMAYCTWDRPWASQIAKYAQDMIDGKSPVAEWRGKDKGEVENVPKKSYWKVTVCTLAAIMAVGALVYFVFPKQEPEPNFLTETEVYDTINSISDTTTLIAAIPNEKPDTVSCSENTGVNMKKNQGLTLAPEQPSMHQASYLTIEGSKKLWVNCESSECSRSFSVSTDGKSFEVECKNGWCNIVSQTNNAFTVRLSNNTDSIERKGEIKVKSDLQEALISITQEAEEE